MKDFYGAGVVFPEKKRNEKITPVLNTGMNTSPLIVH
jgi:hypothetical protein